MYKVKDIHKMRKKGSKFERKPIAYTAINSVSST